MACHEKLGKIFTQLSEHESGLRHFKKMMQIAWAEGSQIWELKAYEQLAISNFYLGELTRSDYYNDRHLRGKCENDDSMNKQTAINQLKQKR